MEPSPGGLQTDRIQVELVALQTQSENLAAAVGPSFTRRDTKYNAEQL